MDFIVRSMGSPYQEVIADEIETGILNVEEAVQLASNMVSAAEDILRIAGFPVSSNACGDTADYLLDVLDEIKKGGND